MKKFAPIFFSSTLLLPSLSFAIGLASIEVQSHLNEPFSARIKLLSLDNLPLNDIHVSLATAQEYERMGMDRSYDLAKIKFSISRGANGFPYVEFHSDESIDDPYIQILLDIRWPEGKLMRGYTVLLDPPNYRLVSKSFRQTAENVDVTSAPVSALTVATSAVSNSQASSSTPAPAQGSATTSSAGLVSNQEIKPVAPTEVAGKQADTSLMKKQNLAESDDEDIADNTDELNTTAVASAKQSIEQAARSTASTPANDADGRGALQKNDSVNSASSKDASQFDQMPVSPSLSAETPLSHLGKAVPGTAKPVNTVDDSADSQELKTVKVGSNDNLWNIAKHLQAKNHLNLEQVMVGLEKANPNAFIKHNMNGLKNGSTLSIPDYEKMAHIKLGEAHQQVYAENQQWHSLMATTHAHDFSKPIHPLAGSNSASDASTSATTAATASVANTATSNAMPTTESNGAKTAPHLEFRPADSEQNPLMQDLSNAKSQEEKTLRAELAMSESATNATAQTNIQLQQALQRFELENEALQQRFNQSQQENNQLRDELTRMTQMLRARGIIPSQVAVDVVETPSLPAQAQSLDLTEPEHTYVSWWAILAILIGSATLGFWYWQRTYRDSIFESENAFQSSSADEAKITEETIVVNTVEKKNTISKDAEKSSIKTEGDSVKSKSLASKTTTQKQTKAKKPAKAREIQKSEVQSPENVEISHDIEFETITAQDSVLSNDDKMPSEENDLSTLLDAGIPELIAKQVDSSQSSSSDDEETLATKLDFAKVYLNMGDASSAKRLLDEVITNGNESQRHKAQSLRDNL